MAESNNYKAVLRTFSTEFRTKLGEIYGKHKLSAELVSREFNLRCLGCRGISRETARRWLTGSALPEYGRLLAVIRWLEIDVTKIFPKDGPVPLTALDNSGVTLESDLRKALDKIAIETNKIKQFLESN